MGTITMNIPTKQNPMLFDKLVGELQRGLFEQLGWLNNSFGIAERLKTIINGRTHYTPNIYLNGNDYEQLLPDSNFGNYSFFLLEEPQELNFVRGMRGEISAPFSFIVWFDIRSINDDRNIMAVEADVLRALTDILTRSGHIEINEVFTKAENVFKGFTLDEVDNQFLMHPYCGFRVTGKMFVEDECY